MFKKIVSLGCCALFSISSFADDVSVLGSFPITWSPIITLSGGPTWTNPGQDLYLYPTIPSMQVNYYTPNTDTDTIVTGELFFGLQHVIQPGMTGELGIGLAGATDARVQGVVAVNNIPNIAVYNYKVDHGRVSLKGRLIMNSYWVQPYVSGGFGPGWNNAHDFRAISNNPALFPAPWFGNQSTIAFSYTLGAGIQAVLNPCWQVGIGYEFADWGTSQLGIDANTQIVGPNLTHLYTNEVLVSVSYMFNNKW
jgi:opacity protein-like surface antigen